MTIRTASINGAALAAAPAFAVLLATEAVAGDIEVRIEGSNSAHGDARVAPHRRVTDGDLPKVVAGWSLRYRPLVTRASLCNLKAVFVARRC